MWATGELNALQYGVSVSFVLREIPTGTAKHPSHRSRSWNAQGPPPTYNDTCLHCATGAEAKSQSSKARHCACAASRVGSYPLDEAELSVGHSQSINANSSLCTAVLLEILTADYEQLLQLSALLNINELDLPKTLLEVAWYGLMWKNFLDW